MNYKRLFIEGTYVFLTIVTSKRRKILIENINILREAFRKTINTYNYELYAICVLPDHIHMIIKPYDINDYPKIVQQLKRYFSTHINKNELKDYLLTDNNIRKKECDIWQHRYWEHTIRDDKDLYKHLDYIHYNPYKHGYTKCVKDWEYSSFKKFVKMRYYEENWYNFEDKYNIADMDYE